MHTGSNKAGGMYFGEVMTAITTPIRPPGQLDYALAVGWQANNFRLPLSYTPDTLSQQLYSRIRQTHPIT